MRSQLTTDVIRRSLLIILLIGLAGCGVAKIKVVKVDGDTTPKHRSVYYALPKTEVVLDISQDTTRTYYVKGSQNTKPISNRCSDFLKENEVKLASKEKRGSSMLRCL